MIVVGYVCGGEAEALLRVTQFQKSRREELKRSLKGALFFGGDGAQGEVSDEHKFSEEMKVAQIMGLLPLPL